MAQIDDVICPKCQSPNSPEAQFCNKCGAKIIKQLRKCKLCGAENKYDAQFCEKCGSKLAEAVLGVTANRANVWEDWVCQNFPFYGDIWADKGDGKKFQQQAKEIVDLYYPNRKLQQSSFKIPVASKDWCIQFIEIDGSKVNKGLFFLMETEVRIVGFNERKVWRIPYEELRSFAFKDGWVLNIDYVNGKTMKIQVRRPGVAGDVLMMIGNTYMGAKGTMVDRHAGSEANRSVVDKVNSKFDVGSNFWGSVTGFLEEVFSHK